jgi:lipoyl(octanoyl) transferase
MQILNLGVQPYAPVEAAMRAYTAERTAESPDQLWLVEHPPVYTQGIAGRDRHVLLPGDIPVIRTDRGGQVTYHGPGQVVAYPLLDLRRLGLHVREYVYRIEEAVIDTLWVHGIVGHRVRSAPGIYVRPDDPRSHAVLQPTGIDPARPFQGLGKIAALGIKVSRHCSYHGVALNVAMDLAPYGGIDPCGHAGLNTVDLKSVGVDVGWAEAAAELALALQRRLQA